MPTYTTTYLFPSPALGETADGPAAITALAARMEREMPTLRASLSDYKDVGGMGVTPGSTAILAHEKDFAVAALGWAEVEVSYALGATDQSNMSPVIAGMTQLWLNDVMVGQRRYHSNGRARQIDSLITGRIALTPGVSNLNIKFRVNADGPSQPVTVFYDDIYATQFGAPYAG